MNLRELQDNGIIVTLYRWEEDLARQIGKARDEQNQGKQNRTSYDASKLMADNALADIHSVCAEIGTCRALGAYCINAVWDKKDHHKFSEIPDGLWRAGAGQEMTELEIKWRRTAKSMPVDRKDAERNRLVLWSEVRLSGCSCEQCNDVADRQETKVRILGGGYAAELWDLGTSYNGDINRVAVPADLLKPIKSLV
jgi:hypothetical protein